METEEPTIETAAETTQYEPCEQCGAPLDQGQRYCVICGFHRRHVRDPAARYIAGARGKRGRTGAAPPRHGSRVRSPTLGTALVIGVIPLAMGLGVLVGRASTNGDGKLIAALRAQQPEVITTGGGSASGSGGSGATTAASTLTSTFPLQSGYAVELQTLPASGTTQSAVTSAEAAVKAKGAAAVGLILQSDYKVTPSPPAGAFVIYSGSFKTSSAASQALAKLHAKFPKAVVIRVQSTSGGGGQVLAKTRYGTAHQVSGFHATTSQLAQGGQIVQQVQKTIGKNYVQSQKGLPDQISVP